MTPINDFGYTSSLPPSASNAMCWKVSALMMPSLGFTPDNATKARVGWRCHVAADRLDEPVANDDGGAVHDLARLDDNLAADQRVNSGRNGPMTGGENVSAESRQ